MVPGVWGLSIASRVGLSSEPRSGVKYDERCEHCDSWVDHVLMVGVLARPAARIVGSRVSKAILALRSRFKAGIGVTASSKVLE